MRYLIVLLVSSVAFGQVVRPPATSPTAPVVLGQIQTTAPINLYVETTGNDTNSCTSALTPCLTIQAAVNKVPKSIRHPVIINVGSGNFTGAILDGFNYMPATNPSAVPGAGLLIQGVMTNSTLTTGTATGTITSSALTGPATHTVITDSTQSWTTDELRGKFVVATSGSASGSVYPCYANTATTVTCAFSTTSGWGSGVTYAIRDMATVINGMVLAPTTVTSTSAGSPSQGFVIEQCGDVSSNTPISFRLLKFSISGTPFLVRNSSLFLQNIDFSGVSMTGTRFLVSSSFSNIRIDRSMAVSANAAGAANACFMYTSATGSFSPVNMSNSYTRGCNLIYAGATNVSNSRVENVQSCGGTGCAAIMFRQVAVTPVIQTTSIDCGSSSSAAISVGDYAGVTPSPTSGGESTALSATNSSAPIEVNNCGVGVIVNKLSNVGSFTNFTGTGNTIGVAVRLGGIYVQHASTTLTGSTADVQLDTENFSLTQIRSLSPKRATYLPTGSTVYEP